MIYKSTPTYPPELHAARKNNFLARVRALTEPRTLADCVSLAYGVHDLEFDAAQAVKTINREETK